MWHLLGCAICGRGHTVTGVPCQDKVLTYQDSEIALIVLADGAGTAQFSHFGAERIVQAVKQLMLQEFNNIYKTEDGVLIKKKLLEYLTNELLELSREYSCEIKEFASTLLFVAIKAGKYVLTHIGDGIIGYQKDNELIVATEPNNGEFVNETVFVTSRNAIQTVKMLKGDLNGITGFVLMSDGAANSLYDKRNKKLAKIITRIMKISTVVPQNVVEKIVENSFNKTVIMYTNDDCSLALMKLGDEDSSYMSLPIKEKMDILGLNAKTKAEQVLRYDFVLNMLNENVSLDKIADWMGIGRKHLQRYLNRLSATGLIEQTKDSYRVNVNC